MPNIDGGIGSSRHRRAGKGGMLCIYRCAEGRAGQEAGVTK